MIADIMREAEKLCDRIAIVHRGKILASDTLAGLRQRHDQNDLEELFFQLISQHDSERDAANEDRRSPIPSN